MICFSSGAKGKSAQLSQRWVETQQQERADKARRVAYLSMEFLMGRSLGNALDCLNLTAGAAQGLSHYAKRLEEVAEREPDAALGNGGLGRLAACFLDAMATVGLPSFGYGIRYEYGMFAQEIQRGTQLEYPETWLQDGTPWEFPRPDISYPVCFGGWVEHQGTATADGEAKPIWRHAGQVVAKAYDMVVPGHSTEHVSTLRLWKAVAPAHIDLGAFNAGDYARAAGMTWAVSTDIIIAAEEAQFGYPEINVGLLPAMHLVHLARIAGRHRAAQLLFTGAIVSADEMYRLGVFNEVLPREQVLPRARALAEELAEKSPISMKLLRDAFMRANDMDYRRAMESVVETMSSLRVSPVRQPGRMVPP